MRWPIQRDEARKYLIKARVYHIMALIFAVIGLILFIFMYMQYIKGRFYEAIQDPSIIVFMLVPFIPAAVLSFLANRLDKKLMHYVDSDKKK